MPNQRTQAQLLGLFDDNDDGDISAGDGRDFIATAFGYASPFDPTPDNDEADSAGIGQFFSIGSKWLNTGTQIIWRCWSGAVHMAVWQPDFNGAPTPPPGFFTARLLAGPTAATGLKVTGLAASAVASSFAATLTTPTDANHLWPQMQCDNFSAGFPSCFLMNVVQSTGAIRFSAQGSGGSFTFDATPLAYDWVETAPDSVTGELFPKPGGQSGTFLTAPALNLEGPALTEGFPVDVFMRKRTTIGGLDVFEFSRLVDPTKTHTVGTPSQPSPTVIDIAGNTTNATNFNFGPNVNVTVNIGGSPTSLIVNGVLNVALLPPGVPVWVGPFTINFNSFVNPAPATIDLFNMPAKGQVHYCCSLVTIPWNGSFGPPASIQYGYRLGVAPTPTDASHYGQLSILNAANARIAGLYNGGQDNQGFATGWTVTSTLTGSNPSTYTQGQNLVWFMVSVLP